jgi:hypothetical protein
VDPVDGRSGLSLLEGELCEVGDGQLAVFQEGSRWEPSERIRRVIFRRRGRQAVSKRSCLRPSALHGKIRRVGSSGVMHGDTAVVRGSTVCPTSTSQSLDHGAYSGR